MKVPGPVEPGLNEPSGPILEAAPSHTHLQVTINMEIDDFINCVMRKFNQ